MLNKDKLEQLAKKLAEQYQTSEPYNHIYIDNFFDESDLNEILEAFPTPTQMDYYKYENPLEKKLAYDQINNLPSSIKNLLIELNSPIFLNFLEKITGIDNLISDPYYRGGGIHQMTKGGKLDIHIDFNIHPKLKLYRRLNVIIFLNKNWEKNWNGDFQVWSGYKDENGEHILNKCHDKIYPIFNRLVIFSTSEKSYHGLPDEISCPEDNSRKSLALYYYTAKMDDVEPHSTTFVKIQEDGLDELRKERNKGRINNNIKTNLI